MGSGQYLKRIIFYIPSLLSSLEVSSVATVSFLLAVPKATTLRKENYFYQNFKLINLT